MTVGQALQKSLDMVGVSQAELARRSGLTTKHVNRMVKDAARVSAYVAVLIEEAVPTINAKHLLLHQLRVDLTEAREARRALLIERLLQPESGVEDVGDPADSP
jgi:plasmid maintenance system antidote protein VapI